MKQHILVLDDDPVRHFAWKKVFTNAHYARANTIEEFHGAIQARRYDTICLDHDLNDHPHLYASLKYDPFGRGDRYSSYLTGKDAITKILELPDDMLPKNVLIHSWNPKAAFEMGELLIPLKKKGVRIIRRAFKYEFYCQSAKEMSLETKYKSIFWSELFPQHRGLNDGF